MVSLLASYVTLIIWPHIEHHKNVFFDDDDCDDKDFQAFMEKDENETTMKRIMGEIRCLLNFYFLSPLPKKKEKLLTHIKQTHKELLCSH